MISPPLRGTILRSISAGSSGFPERRFRTIYIDGEPLTAEEESLCSASMAGLAEYPVELGEDEYFLLGDNRESSEDSRFESIGNVSRSQMAGKVWLRIAPASGFGWVR